MGMPNYPAGFTDGIVIRGVPLLQLHPGRVFWVGQSSGSLQKGEKSESNGNKGGFLDPFATVVYAMSQCVANRGDIIIIKPGHTENINTANMVTTLNNVAIIGLGAGPLRPVFSFISSVNASLLFQGNGSSISNCLFSGGVDALVKPINITATDVSILNCEWRDTTGQATDAILTSATAHRLLIDGWFHNGDTAAGANSSIALVGGSHAEVKNARFLGNFAVGAIDIRTTAAVDINLHDFSAKNYNASCIGVIDTITGSTGKIGPNINLQLLTNGANITEAITGATFVVYDPVYVVNLAGEKAMLINWIASTDA